ncbi:MAG: hypothetical protein IPN90_10150 [Elusimicrobia bacterium]|nr:hypothetical protein [Elusimicrobiota bacterium]
MTNTSWHAGGWKDAGPKTLWVGRTDVLFPVVELKSVLHRYRKGNAN